MTTSFQIRRWPSRPVFITSTFVDMQAERDHLRNVVFPELEERLRERHHHLEPIDLRWGVETRSVDDEHAKELLVLKVCLDEVKRSRPFLIGLVGDRYGWRPPPERMEAATREAGFRTDVAGKSVTELEIEYGVLDQPDQKKRSFFYFRNRLPYDDMPPEIASGYSELHGQAPDAREKADRLARLKERIRKQMLGRVRDYTAVWDPENLKVTGLEKWGKQVLDDLWKELDEATREYARGPVTSWQEQENEVLEEFVEDRSRDFIGRTGLCRRVLEAAESPASEEGSWGMCITGESGSGKSALFAHLVRQFEDRDVLLLVHAAGIGPASVRVDSMLRRWTGMLAKALGVADPLDDSTKDKEVEETFQRFLSRASRNRRVVLLVDALNQFETTPRARHATWLPKLFPQNARFVATTIPGVASEALDRRPGVEIIDLPLLSAEESKDIAVSVCERYHRTVNPEVIRVLLEKRQDDRAAAGIPLWLELAVEELNLLDEDDFARANREFEGNPEEKLHQMILDTARRFPADVEGLYGEMLQRTEDLFGEAWARAFAVLIAVSRQGWRELDLRQMMPDVARMFDPDAPVEEWDPLRFAGLRRAFRAHLVERGERSQWDFFHTQARSAVRSRSLHGLELEKRLHTRIADHLESLPVGDPLRQTELMFHLIGADDRPRAARYYAGLEEAKFESSSATSTLVAHIVGGEANEKERKTQPPDSNPGLTWVMSLLEISSLSEKELAALCSRYQFYLLEMLENDLAVESRRSIAERVCKIHKELVQKNPKDLNRLRNLSISLAHVGNLYHREGLREKARHFFRQANELAVRLAKPLHQNSRTEQINLSSSLAQMGLLSLEEGDLVQAEKSYQEAFEIAERMYKQVPNDADAQQHWAKLLQDMGGLRIRMGESDQAIQYYLQCLQILRQLAAAKSEETTLQGELAELLNKIGSLYARVGNLNEARKFLQQALELDERLVDDMPDNLRAQHRLSASLFNMGDLMQREGQVDQANQIFQRCLSITERLARFHPDTMPLQGDLARLLLLLGDLSFRAGKQSEARRYYQRCLEISERRARILANDVEAQRSLSIVQDRFGDLHLKENNPTQAMGFFLRCMETRERIASTQPENRRAQLDWSAAVFKTGDILVQAENFDLAEQVFQKLVDSFERIVGTSTADTESMLVLTQALPRLGELNLNRGNKQKAVQRYQRAVELNLAITETKPADREANRSLAMVLERLGELFLQEGDRERSGTCLDEVLQIKEYIAKAYPADVMAQADSWEMFFRMGRRSLEEGNRDPEKARQYFERCLKILAEQVEAHPDNINIHLRLGELLQELADIYLGEGEDEQASRFLKQSIDVRKRIAGDVSNEQEDVTRKRLLQALDVAENESKARPEDVGAQRGVAEALQRIGDLDLQHGSPEKARGFFERNLVVRERLAKTLSDDPDAQTDLAVAHLAMSTIFVQIGDNSRMMECLKRCHEVLRAMRVKGMALDPGMEELLEQLDAS